MSDFKRRTPFFRVGQVVHHKRFGYRGVIVDAHNGYEGSDELKKRVSPSAADRNSPWYQILVHNRAIETYEAEIKAQAQRCRDTAEELGQARVGLAANGESPAIRRRRLSQQREMEQEVESLRKEG